MRPDYVQLVRTYYILLYVKVGEKRRPMPEKKMGRRPEEATSKKPLDEERRCNNVFFPECR